MTEPSRPGSRALQLLLFAGLGMTALPFFLLTRYLYPVADDMCYASWGLELGQFGAMYRYYTQWGGRYFPTLVLNGFAIPVRLLGYEGYYVLYRVYMFCALLALSGSVYLVARAVSRGRLARLPASILGFLFLALLLTNMPSLGDFYHLPYMTTYFLGGIVLPLLALALAMPLLDGRLPWRRHLPRLGVASLLCFAAAGANESSALSISLLVGLGALATWRRRDSAAASWRVLLLVVIVGAAISLGSPGNSGRMLRYQDVEDRTHDTAGSLTRASHKAVKEPLQWLTRPSFLAAGALTLLGGLALAPGLVSGGAPGFRIAGLSAALTFFLQVFYRFPSLWATSWNAPPRVINTALAVAILGGLTAAFFLGLALRPWLDRSRLGSRSGPALLGLTALAALATVGLFLSSGAFRAATDDLRHRARPFARQMHERYDGIIRAAERGEEHVRVTPLHGPLPRIIRFESEFPWNVEMAEDPEHGMNACYARFFGVDTVVLTAEDSTKEP